MSLPSFVGVPKCLAQGVYDERPAALNRGSQVGPCADIHLTAVCGNRHLTRFNRSTERLGNRPDVTRDGCKSSVPKLVNRGVWDVKRPDSNALYRAFLEKLVPHAVQQATRVDQVLPTHVKFCNGRHIQADPCQGLLDLGAPRGKPFRLRL